MWYYVGTSTLTAVVYVDDKDLLIRYPPTLERFRFQHIDNLKRWLATHDEYVLEAIPDYSHE